MTTHQTRRRVAGLAAGHRVKTPAMPIAAPTRTSHMRVNRSDTIGSHDAMLTKQGSV